MDKFFINKQDRESRIRENDWLDRKTGTIKGTVSQDKTIRSNGRCRNGDRHPKNDREPND